VTFFKEIFSKNIRLKIPFLENEGYEIFMKREDLIHPIISGNKFRKLKYNIKEIKNKNLKLVTFGGAFSNHLLAVAYISKIEKIKAIGIVRGEELDNFKLNPTLKKCIDYGMKLKFVSRDEYRLRHEKKYLEKLISKHNNAFIIPEGGTNELGIKGCEEILNSKDIDYFETICVPVGSGGTISGIINSSSSKQKILGFSSLKKSNITVQINKFVNKNNYKIIDENYFGGYAKFNSQLVDFINQFYYNHEIKLDPIYNSKMIFRILNDLRSNKWNYGKKILLINTGGLQSIDGFNKRLKEKKCATIDFTF